MGSFYSRLVAAIGLAAMAGPLPGQLIPAGSPIPRHDKLPVIFLNGYQQDCSGSSFSNTFGKADSVLQANGEAVVFFDNCSITGRPLIEDLGTAFGTFLAGLKYDDGQPVTQVDVVAHSMGGLILRSYLSGKSTGGGFQPPPTTRVRKAIFLATPHFGTPIASLLGLDRQVSEMASGNPFLFELATWNQGTDDLRDVDALAAIGNGGNGLVTTPGFDDGVVPLTSGSIGFAVPGRTRVLPFCHVPVSGVVGLVCPSSAKGIANIQSADDPQAKMIVSFLNGTNEWQSIGTAAEEDPFLSISGGLELVAHAPDDSPLNVDSAKFQPASGSAQNLGISAKTVAFTDRVAAGAGSATAVSGDTTLTGTLTVRKAAYSTYLLKTGPLVGRVTPAAATTLPLVVAPGQFVTVWGEALAATTESAQSVSYPTQLAGTTVLVNGVASQLTFAGPSQINAVMPDAVAGLVKLTVQNATGSNSVNVLVEAAMPALFTQDFSGSGPAAALKGTDNTLITGANPLRAGDYVSLYLTGLGATVTRDGLDWAVQPPSVFVGGQPCPVSYAGRAPGYRGLDQINCVIPSGTAPNDAVPVWVTAGTRISNIATLAIR